ncbi:hypothetical protein DENSPDRAFT_405354 [Dentipellis sp. KUC8613]|nr:hypothetical protein DENSPDRAFT_405354 [Dentipellis sp. KUC8613]
MQLYTRSVGWSTNLLNTRTMPLVSCTCGSFLFAVDVLAGFWMYCGKCQFISPYCQCH